MNWNEYLKGWSQRYRDDLVNDIMPFWLKNGLDRVNGAMCTVGEIIGILFEDEGGREDYFQKLRRDLLSTLEEVGCSSAIVHKRGMLGVAITELWCDYYDYLSNKKELSISYFGEYMSQYSFAEYTNAQLYARLKESK